MLSFITNRTRTAAPCIYKPYILNISRNLVSKWKENSRIWRNIFICLFFLNFILISVEFFFISDYIGILHSLKQLLCWPKFFETSPDILETSISPPSASYISNRLVFKISSWYPTNDNSFFIAFRVFCCTPQ